MRANPALDLDLLSSLSHRRREAGRRSKATLTAAASIAGHLAVVAGVLVLPLVIEDTPPEQAPAVRAFFAPLPELAPPPPPPPPPAARAPRHDDAPRPVPGETLTAPIAVPEQVVPEAVIGPGLEDGNAGGVEGGVPGGVVGGVVGAIVGGLSEPSPPPLVPLRVGAAVREPRKVKDVRPVYPALAISSRVQGVVILECVVDTLGHVQEARVLRGIPLLDEAALDAVRQWVYSTTLVDGVPVPVVMTVTVTFRLS
jgi:protein TonB